MCKKAMYAAIGKIESELANDEKIIWSGFPDRKMINNKIKSFYWRNVAFFICLGMASVGTLFVSPPQTKAILILLSAVALVRSVGSIFAWRSQKQHFNRAYALTDKRLISVDGRNEEMASWYSPSIDSLRVKKHKNTATFKLRDSELGFTMILSYVANAQKLKSLLTPYTTASLSMRQNNIKSTTPSILPKQALQPHNINEEIRAAA